MASTNAFAVPVHRRFQLLCCTPTAHWLEYADWWNPILAEPLHVEKGMPLVNGVVGTGVDWKEDALARFAA